MLNLSADSLSAKNEEASDYSKTSSAPALTNNSNLVILEENYRTELYAIPEEDDTCTQYSLTDLDRCLQDDGNDNGIITS